MELSAILELRTLRTEYAVRDEAGIKELGGTNGKQGTERNAAISTEGKLESSCVHAQTLASPAVVSEFLRGTPSTPIVIFCNVLTIKAPSAGC
mmetsp:Transcript_5833/g.10317  ORF Transcript_5833/g.10317 Transcript_5833/m.10317 type:complete len:93 (-) Transcript_5833:1381-1659(-)